MTVEYLRTWAEIDLDAIVHNFDIVKNKISPATRLQAVIKANGYGHGAVPIAKTLEGKADYFGVAMLDEAVELRNAGIKTPIMLLAYTSPAEFLKMLEYSITATIFTLKDAVKLNYIAASLGIRAKIHIAIETGMGRVGFWDDDTSINEIIEISQMSNIEIEGIFSHFARADELDKGSAISQVNRFEAFTKKLFDNGINVPIRHLYNSAAAIDFEPRYEMVREGIALYGLYPSDEVSRESLKFKPAMSLKTKVTHVKTVEAGCGISYGHIYTTKCLTKVATLSIGYADGMPRLLSSKGRVLIHGRYAPIIGRICMDQMMVDVTDIPDVIVGDVATVIGKDGDNEILADELATQIGTINYEIVCGITGRVPRVYFKNGEFMNIVKTVGI